MGSREGNVQMKNIVFMIAFELDQRARDQGYEWSIRSWKYWCEKHNVSLFVLDKPLMPLEEMKATWQRYYVFDIMEQNNIEYDQICMVDSDTIIHPNTPNFFNMTDHKFTAVVDFGSMDWFCRSIEVYSKLVFENNMINYWEYVNGGFQIINDIHRPFYNKFISFYNQYKDHLIKIQDTYHPGTDQTPLNYFLKYENIEVNFLPYEFNMTDMGRIEILGQDMLFTKFGWIYHFNCWPKPTPRYWLEQTYRYLNEIKT